MATYRVAQPTVGYSGKPLHRKLGLAPGIGCCLIYEPTQLRGLLEIADELTLETELDGLFDYVHLFVAERKVLEAELAPAAAHVAVGGMLGVSWPKQSSPLHRDVSEDVVRAVGLRTEFVDVKVCAVDKDWSALKFLRRKGK